MDALSETGLRDDTLLVLIGDHGKKYGLLIGARRSRVPFHIGVDVRWYVSVNKIVYSRFDARVSFLVAKTH